MSSRIMEELYEIGLEEGRRKARETPLPQLLREIAEYERQDKRKLRQDVVRRLLRAGPLTTEEIAGLLGVSPEDAARVMKTGD